MLGGWERSIGCDPDNSRWQAEDKTCSAPITRGMSGNCICLAGASTQRVGFDCDHPTITCDHVCGGAEALLASAGCVDNCEDAYAGCQDCPSCAPSLPKMR